ncbi:hypothetical protein BUALT_Bualt07G0068900 [Buddleja alternifolia]|uniref:Uncharacterized protein n=1 Tax=Buddleja alternifolia TaxID=168488 RepID=A0AAV6X9Q5_9LAMI|nr:hypothetical protein BUALT_Bualt07G0068900 [Buddleja alternifolia]
MGFAALISLKRTIECPVNSSRVSFPNPCPELEFLYDELLSLEKYLFSLDDRATMNREYALYGQIRESLQKLAGVIESRVSTQFSLSQSQIGDHETAHPSTFSTDWNEFLERTYILGMNRMEATSRLKDALGEFLSESESGLGDESIEIIHPGLDGCK